jgi:hypothetical protein
MNYSDPWWEDRINWLLGWSPYVWKLRRIACHGEERGLEIEGCEVNCEMENVRKLQARKCRQLAEFSAFLMQTFQVTHLHQCVILFWNQIAFLLLTEELEGNMYTSLVNSLKLCSSLSDFAVSSYLCHNLVEILRRENAWEKQVVKGIQRRERQELGK